MKLPYFPGCTLYTKARGFDRSARVCVQALGFELVELPQWNCCGATFPLSVDNLLDLTGPARILIDARQEGDQLAVACSTCYNVLKRTNRVLQSDEDSREKINFFVEADYQGDLEVVHLLEILRDIIGYDRIRTAVRRPLTGLKVAAYYGCLLLRPPREIGLDDPDNPQVMENLMRALGAEAVDYPHFGECCGAYLSVKSAEAATECSHTILASARKNSADLVVTSCPLCQFNLDHHQEEMKRRHAGFEPIPVLYFTQLLGLALGLDTAGFDFDGHYIDPRSVLEMIESEALAI